MIFLNPEDIPEELKQQIEQQHMAQDAVRHDMQRFFEELPKEHLLTFRSLIHSALTSNTKIYLGYLDGLAAATLHHVHKVCGGCGKNHEEEAMNALTQQPEVVVPQASEQVELLATEYGVELLEGGQVKCINCGLEYVSLDDRMLRKPKADGCHGCQQKSAFG